MVGTHQGPQASWTSSIQAACAWPAASVQGVAAGVAYRVVSVYLAPACWDHWCLPICVPAVSVHKKAARVANCVFLQKSLGRFQVNLSCFGALLKMVLL